MRKFSYALIILLVLTVVIYFCTSGDNIEGSTESLTEDKDIFSLDDHIAKYELLRENIIVEQKNLGKSYAEAVTTESKKKVLNLTKKYLVEIITQKMFDFWYGTKWSYDGTTETPLSGEIACGYFISTVLKHSGFNLDRYKLAKQPSSLIVKSLCHKSTIKIFNSSKQIESYLENNSNSLYILGLDKHVGFVFKYGDNIRFIHSSYTLGRSVMSEPLSDSVAISSSNMCIKGNLLDNVSILEKWLKNEKIKIITM